jgi:hypothetical protein
VRLDQQESGQVLLNWFRIPAAANPAQLIPWLGPGRSFSASRTGSSRAQWIAGRRGRSVTATSGRSL